MSRCRGAIAATQVAALVAPWLGLRADPEPIPVTATSPPAAGESYVDPGFGTRIVRVTNAGGGPGIVPEYSKAQAFNADGSRFLLHRTDGRWALYDGRALRALRSPNLPGGEIEPRWSPTAAARLTYVRGDSVWNWSLRTRKSVRVARFPGLGRLSSGGEQELSLDGRYLAFHGAKRAAGGNFVSTRAFVVDLRTGRRGPITTLRPHEPGETLDYVSITPDGRRVIVMWSRSGAYLYSRSWHFLRRLTTWDEHGDVCRSGDGRFWFVVAHYRPEPDDEVVEAVALDRDEVRTLWQAPTAMGLHVSCRASAVRDWAIVSTYGIRVGDPGTDAFDNEVFALSLESAVGAPVVRRLAGTRMILRRNYVDEPHATVSRDGRIVLFGSSFQRSPNPLPAAETWAIDLRAG